MGFSGLDGGLFTQNRGSAEVLQKQSPEGRKLPSVQATSDSFFFWHIIFKNKEQKGLMCALMIALYFYSSISSGESEKSASLLIYT